LRVLLVPEWYPSPENPVAGLFMRDLGRAIAAISEVVVLAPPSATAPRDARDDGVRTIRQEPGAAPARLRAIDATVARLRREGWRPDLIHAHTFSGGVLAGLVGRRRRLPVVITENYSALLTGGLSPRETRIARFAYRNAAVVCPVSGLLQRRLAELEPRGRYRVVPDIVDVQSFAQPPIRRTGPRTHVVAVSMLVPRKGLIYLIDAVRVVVATGREISLSIAGDGPDRELLAERASGLPVSFLGALPRAQVIELVRRADAFAWPTLAAPFGIAAVEALAAGVPVVVTSGSGTADVIGEHGGIVVPPRDADAIAAALSTLLDDRRAVPAETLHELDAWCSPRAVAALLDEIYRSL
jgi:glycosyltransferase involved in cell wall biosynthesis